MRNGYGLSLGFGFVNWSGGEKFNAHTVGLMGLLYESGAEVGVKEVGAHRNAGCSAVYLS